MTSSLADQEEVQAPMSSNDTSHPYHSNGSIQPSSDSTPAENGDPSVPTSKWSKSSKTSSDSGTEADDESTGVLRRLPAPSLRPRKGLRLCGDGLEGDNRAWLPALQPWHSLPGRSTSRSSRRSSGEEADFETVGMRQRRLRRKTRVEVLRRLSETLLLLSVGGVVLLPEGAREVAWAWKKGISIHWIRSMLDNLSLSSLVGYWSNWHFLLAEILTHCLLVAGLYAAYPLTVSKWRHDRGRMRLVSRLSFPLPSSFDPAPLLYPILLPIYVSLSLTQHRPALILPNVILSLSSLPASVIPLHYWKYGYSISHWMVTMIPVVTSEHFSSGSTWPKPLFLRGLNPEVLFLLFPLHQELISILDFLLSTSVLPAELQLLTTALINLFMFSTSPQAEILKALLWLGGMCILIFCRHILRWEVALARIPSWKFRRSSGGWQSPRGALNAIDNKICEKLSRTGSPRDSGSDSEYLNGYGTVVKKNKKMDSSPRGRPNGHKRAASGEIISSMASLVTGEHIWRYSKSGHKRRHTVSSFEEVTHSERVRTTPSGRRKRLMAPELASFLSMTTAQAQVRKWAYALCAYAAVLGIVMGPIRIYVGGRALNGNEPFGWVLGYFFGNVTWFRFWVILLDLERWISLPVRIDSDDSNKFCDFGWVENVRHHTLGEANTRLWISAYYMLVLVTGLATVLKLSSIVEVDTRRKVFHGMMVMMFLPTIYVDPAFCALALALVLSIFLLLDLFRASQLPPISRPLTNFLAPYVDGRDYRGPVIVSHVFLLIGCSIPLWLSLADVPRMGTGPWEGWDVVSRQVSMVSGVICVGMGDAAASLVGRRFGRLKWFWGGGKSLEGSISFALAVFCGLTAARAWITLGGWLVSGSDGSYSYSWLWAASKVMLAAMGASATEAVLTGCNDNVVVPVVLWLLVRGLGI